MKLGRITGWLDRFLDLAKFDDVSNNGVQIAREGDDVSRVAFAVDASAESVRAAAAAGAQLLVVHHGISWGGGIRRIVGSEYAVVRAAVEANLALYAAHLPLDANRACGNNWEIARALGLGRVRPAFSYHGNVIGVVGALAPGRSGSAEDGVISGIRGEIVRMLGDGRELKVGVCSGGAGEFAVAAKGLGCDVYVTGEASWGDVVAARNVGMPMVCAGHYETETFGVRALAKAMAKALKVATTFVALAFALALPAAAEEADFGEECGYDRFYAGVAASLSLPQGGQRMARSGGAAARLGAYLSESFAVEGEAAWQERLAGLAVRGLWHWRGWEEYDMLFGYSRFDPFFTFGARGWLPGGQVGPSVGAGALWYLSDHWALRADADAALGLEAPRGMVYSLALGAQYSF